MVDFHKRILFSDEAHFWLNGYVNKQNCRIWSEANPQVNHDDQELRFQQDGATCHTARATINLLKDTFGDHLISRFGPVNRPPRSCDLTPLDYFLWGYVKSVVYADEPQTLAHLEDNIRRVIADIRPQMLEKVIENWTSRLDYIRASRGMRSKGDLHNGASRINPENRVGSSFKIIPEQYFSGVENIDDFLENIDHNLAYYEIPAQLACAYLKGLLKGRALDWFEVLGYRVIEDKATDYAHLKQALSAQFPVVRNRSEVETRFYSSSQRRDQQPSDFIYELLKIHKVLKPEMSEEKLIDHVVSRLEPQILDYVEVRHPQNTANLLQIVDKYEERFMNRHTRGSSEGFRSSNPNENNRFNTRHRQENWRENGNNARSANNSRPQTEFNRFENQGFANNRRFEGRRQGRQSDQRFHNQGDRQSGSRNSSFRGQNERSRHLNF
ncbi:uncharacterized protein TNCV_2077631 [Trichonephila clavipes]|nr:uncharacterized protein TNCV_2077631 [Trichonephila clavipes]